MGARDLARRIGAVAALAAVLALGAGAALAQEVQQVTANRVKALLAEGKPALGVLMTLPSAPAAQVLARTGIDWLWIDMEHGPIGIETAHHMVMATQGTEVVPVVRVPWNLHWLAKPALDIGAMGVVFPFIRTPEDARAAVASVRYPPDGVRGFGPGYAALRWGLPVPEYVALANREVMAILMIEHIEAVERIDELLAVEGVDLVFVGPFDLSGTMGVLGRTTEPRVEQAIQAVLAAAKAARVPAGIVAFTPADARRRLDEGFRFLAVGVDTLFLAGGARAILGELRN